jgi:hypothetical protein
VALLVFLGATAGARIVTAGIDVRLKRHELIPPTLDQVIHNCRIAFVTDKPSDESKGFVPHCESLVN